MNPVRKSLVVALLAGGSIAGAFAGSVLVRDVNPAFAQDAPATPEQGKVTDKPTITEQDIAHVETLATVFRKVGKTIEPTVVNINVLKSGGASGRTPAYEDMLRRFFPDLDGDGKPDLPEGFNDPGLAPGAPGGGGDDAQEFQQQGTGSGVIMEVHGNDAYILTNNHVAGGATEILVTLADGRRIDNGTVVGTDPKTDLAVIKVNAENLVAAPWGDSDKLEKGDWIMAFGSPFNFVGSMTHGIVSALNRRAGILGQNGYEQFIQVDAPINPGNSGGPLVNVRGEVVGINTAIASRNGGFQGIGFAIPSNQAKPVYTALKANGKVVRGWIGVVIQDASADLDLMRSFGYEGKTGVLVRQTFKNTPATDKLQAGDIVTALAGKAIKDTRELRNTIAATPPGTDLVMTVFRDGKNQDVSVTIAEQPEDMTAAAGGGPRPGGDPAAQSNENRATAMGLKLMTPNDQSAEQFNLGETRQGALVTEIEPNSAAAKSELRRGDVITRVGTSDVLTARQAADALKAADAANDIRLYVTDSEASRFVIIKPKKDSK